MSQSDFTRQLDFYDPSKSQPSVLVVGAGATGSYVVFALARLGVKNITVVDFDNIVEHNLPNQFFTEDLTREEEALMKGAKLFKVNHLENTIKTILPDFTMVKHIKPIQEIAFAEGFDYIFPLVDDMVAQKYIWENVEFKTLIGSRVGGHYANIYCADKGDEYYAGTLHSNGEAIQEPCTGRSVVDLSMQIAGICVTAFRQHLKGNIKWKHLFIDYSVGQMMIMQKKEVVLNEN